MVCVCVCVSGKDSWELKASAVWGSATKGSEGASVANLANTLPGKKENKMCDDLSSKLNKWKTSVTSERVFCHGHPDNPDTNEGCDNECVCCISQNENTLNCDGKVGEEA